MTAFSPDQMDAVLAKCQSSGEAIGSAFSAAFGGDFQVETADPIQLNPDDLPANLAGAGLVFAITVDETPCLALFSQAGELLPEWCTEPDDESAKKLDQLGVELATALFPTETEAKAAGVKFHPDLGAAVRESQPTSESVCLPLVIAKGEESAQLSLIWPVTSFIDLMATAVAEQEGASAPEPVAEKEDASASEPVAGELPRRRRLVYTDLEDGIRQLPQYAQSLLRIKVPVTVTLATTRARVSKVLEMAPGTILQFTKTCDSNLTMEVGRQEVAEGEAVKVGDKFGLWITSMTMPEERFWSVTNRAETKRVK